MPWFLMIYSWIFKSKFEKKNRKVCVQLFFSIEEAYYNDTNLFFCGLKPFSSPENFFIKRVLKKKIDSTTYDQKLSIPLLSP